MSADRKGGYLVKVIVIGDSGVGKTNLITRFTENDFKETYVATIGVDFKVKGLKVNDKKIKMQIWDTAGQQRFKNITQTYYKGAKGILLAYSITDSKSFSNIQRWINQIQQTNSENPCKLLVATKLDLERDRVVSKQAGQQLAAKFGMKFMEVSAKSGHQVQQSFQQLASQIQKSGLEEKGQFQEKKGKALVLKETPGEPRKNCAC